LDSLPVCDSRSAIAELRAYVHDRGRGDRSDGRWYERLMYFTQSLALYDEGAGAWDEVPEYGNGTVVQQGRLF